MEHVGEIHLGGLREDRDDLDARLLIDAHGTPVADIVWLLYRRTLARLGPVPTLIEWDNDVPAFSDAGRRGGARERIMKAEIKRRERQSGAAAVRVASDHDEGSRSCWAC